MGHLGLGLRLGMVRARPAEAAPLLPLLSAGPNVAGSAPEGGVLVSDESDSWTIGVAAASVLAREYRFLLDGAVAAGPGTSASVAVPAGSGGRFYRFEIRVTVAEGGGARSAWTAIAAGTVAEALTLNQTADGELELDDTDGTITVTITSPSWYAHYDAGNGAGVFNFDSGALATGPVNLVPPQIIDDGTPAEGEALTLIPGLWIYDPDAGGLGAPSYQWQADGAGNGTFASIPGADSGSYTLSPGESGDDVRVLESLSDNGGSRTVSSAAVSVAAPAATFMVAYAGGTQLPAPAGNPTTGIVSIGAADANRWVVLVVRTIQNAAGAPAMNAVTVGGVPCTTLVQPTFQSRFSGIFIANAKITTGAETSFSLDWLITPDAGAFVRVDAYTILASKAPTLVNATNDGGSGFIDLAVQAGDAVIASVVFKNGIDPSGGWAGVTHRHSLTFGTGILADDWGSLADDLYITAPSTLRVSNNQTGTLVGALLKETP
ncbi:hypothetical protein P6F26_14425 [Roseibacterium sp. SDUM158017]|uniref:hypothetical protein n=1 Tax=Roseicyclus salinarum TaxID=3036773 RepID=UPI0024152CE7|nr:hypothetical protein [Roseibacterium sp. SDUM158017]MDG4649637.1 hypothetical protein [Roseibacterium sp. SDUM158017]